MRIPQLQAAVVGCLFALMSANAWACGESLFRVGKGVNFREYTAPLPGRVLVVASTEAELRLAASLSAAGHDIHVVSEPGMIGAELKVHEFDIVLAYLSQQESVLAQIGKLPVAYIPVVDAESDEEAEALQQFEVRLSSNDSTRTFLKTIHRTLKARA